jgi:hypothetical protein
MATPFFGGAYDGLELDYEQINACCDVFSTPAENGGRRKFVILPPAERWDDLAAGRISKADTAECGPKWMYELKITQAGVEWHNVNEL